MKFWKAVKSCRNSTIKILSNLSVFSLLGNCKNHYTHFGKVVIQLFSLHSLQKQYYFSLISFVFCQIGIICLSFRKNKPNSQSEYGWQKFTDNVIRKISADREGVVFLLWGAFAGKKENLVDHKKHAVVRVSYWLFQIGVVLCLEKICIKLLIFWKTVS